VGVLSVTQVAAARSQASQFQRFVMAATGQDMPIFGNTLFGTPATFAPITNIAPPASYVLGAGDEIQLQVWGSVDVSTRLVVDRNGQVQVPRVGLLSVAGVSAGQLNGVFSAHMAKVFTNIEVSATVASLRNIQVYVVGQAQQPGTYTLSSLSTLVNALFASGGPNANGSMRAIELRRGNKTVSTIDLYAFITKGDKSADVVLQPGDVIVIPPVGPRVAVTGAYDHNAIYEIKGGTTIGQLLSIGGGVPTLTATQKALLERINPQAEPPRQVAEIALNAIGLETALKDGDVLTLMGITPEFGNAVTLKGSVASALRHAWKPNMRVLDLIPEPAALISADYYQRRNQLVQTLGGASNVSFDAINWEYAVIERLDRTTLTNQFIPFNLGRAVLSKDPSQNLLLQPGDVVTVFNQNDIRLSSEKQLRLVRVEGEVAAPGLYPALPGETLPQLLRRIGGLTSQAYVFGTEFTRQSVRVQQQQNLDQVVRRLEATFASQTTTLMTNASANKEQPAALLGAQQQRLERIKALRSNGRVALELQTDSAELSSLPPLQLENGDTVFVPSTPSFVAAYGAVNNENAIVYRPGRTVGDVLRLAGLTEDADESNMFVLRADGTVMARAHHSGWLGGGYESTRLMPGDTVVVPPRVDRETAWTAFMRNAKDITQILANLGLGVAALRSL